MWLWSSLYLIIIVWYMVKKKKKSFLEKLIKIQAQWDSDRCHLKMSIND